MVLCCLGSTAGRPQSFGFDPQCGSSVWTPAHYTPITLLRQAATPHALHLYHSAPCNPPPPHPGDRHLAQKAQEMPGAERAEEKMFFRLYWNGGGGRPSLGQLLGDRPPPPPHSGDRRALGGGDFKGAGGTISVTPRENLESIPARSRKENSQVRIRPSACAIEWLMLAHPCHIGQGCLRLGMRPPPMGTKQVLFSVQQERTFS